MTSLQSTPEGKPAKGIPQPPGRCRHCGVAFQWVRPGKSQSMCDCWRRCHVHGAGAIDYHHYTDVPGSISGYICWQCQYPDAPQPTEKP